MDIQEKEITLSEVDSIFLTSDSHFFHKNANSLCGRPFSSVEEMNEKLIENWNKTVSSDDTVYFLGDFAFCGTQKIETILKQLNRKKFVMIRGNHDRHVSDKRWLELGVDEIYSQLYLPDFNILLCHFPYLTGAEGEDVRYLNLRPSDDGVPLVHGHCHHSPANKIRFTHKNTCMYDVGVDANDMCPVALDKVMEELSSYIIERNKIIGICN